MSPRKLVLLGGVIGAGVTLGAVLVPGISFVYRSSRLHTAMETAAVLIGLMAAALVFGRFKQRGRTQDLVVVYVLIVLALTNLFFSAVPGAFGVRPDETFLAWTQTTARLVATALLALAAFMGPKRSTPRGASGVSVATAATATLLLIAGVALALTPLLPHPLGSVTIEEGSRPSVDGDPVFLGAQLAQMVLLGAAAGGFLKKAGSDQGELTGWIAAACVLAAFSRFNYFLFPSRYTDYVYVGDLLRLGFYLCLLIGGARQLSSYWRSLADAQLGEARRRLARDLHDGLAQELVLISAQTQRLLKRGADAEGLHRLNSAAERAVAESRRAINALSSEREQSLEEAIEELGEETSRRVGVKVELDLQPVATSPDIREALIRIVREALSNAVRHSSADCVRIELRDDDGPHVKVTDDGVGFEPDKAREGRAGFGLLSLTERAKALGGDATVSSSPGAGTEITVRLPSG